MCGEYGGETWRPHYHALIFGWDPPDKSLFKRQRGVSVFLSPTITRLWGMGHCTVGTVTFESAAYVARYVMKKMRGPEASGYYSELDPYTGELLPLKPEYTRMSLRGDCAAGGGIGAEWFARHKSDFLPADEVIHDGKRFKVPKYYDTLFERIDGQEALQNVKAQRERRAEARASENTPKRLKAREKVLRAKTSKLKRELDDDSGNFRVVRHKGSVFHSPVLLPDGGSGKKGTL